jgi:hypothetical protein
MEAPFSDKTIGGIHIGVYRFTQRIFFVNKNFIQVMGILMLFGINGLKMEKQINIQ